jgi:hypothetical protein
MIGRMMNPRERLMAILNKEKRPDKAGWSPLIDGYYMSSFPADKDIIDLFRQIDADVMERHVFTWESSFRRQRTGKEQKSDYFMDFSKNGVRVMEELKKVPKGTLQTARYEIPGHVLTSKSIYTPHSPYIPFPLEYFIKSVDDIEAYIYIKKKESYSTRYQDYISEDKRIGDLGIATDSAPTSPIQEVVQHLCGIEKFYTELFTDHFSVIEKLMETMHEKNIELYKLIADSPASVVINYENTSSTLVSPDIYERYSLPHIDDYADVLHKKDKIYLTHRCGKLKDLVKLIGRGKDDGIIDISPRPTGDLDIWDAREAWPEKIVQGGIDATMLTQWSSGKIKEYTGLILKKAGGLDRLIIGTGDATPKDAKIENLIAVGKAINDKKYSGHESKHVLREGR